MNGVAPPRAGANLARAISRENLANLPIRRYEGEVKLVATGQDMDAAWADFERESVVGLDSESRPAFRKGESYLPSLVQAATARAVYLFQLQRKETFPALAALLASPNTVKAGVSLAEDLRQLSRVFPFEQRNVIDVGLAARRAGLKQTGVRNLAGIALGFRIAKGARTSNWAAPRLTPRQIAYAATDAWVCRELYLRFETLGLIAG